MKGYKIFYLILMLFFISSCASVYYSPELKNRTSSHKKIAFIPFEIIISVEKMPKKTTIEQIEQMEKDLSITFQEQIYERFLNKKSNFNIEFQNVSTTNSLLKSNNINSSNIKKYTKKQLAEKLNVDAVVSGLIFARKPFSTGGSVAIALLSGFFGSTNEVDATILLNDGKDGQLLFKFNDIYSGSIGSKPEKLTKAMVKKIEKKFPYRID